MGTVGRRGHDPVELVAGRWPTGGSVAVLAGAVAELGLGRGPVHRVGWLSSHGGVVPAAVQAHAPAPDVITLRAVIAAVFVGPGVASARAAVGGAVALVHRCPEVTGLRRESDDRIDRLQRIALVPSVGAVEEVVLGESPVVVVGVAVVQVCRSTKAGRSRWS